MTEAQLYFDVYAMPDGSKRRPLFEREPKMRFQNQDGELLSSSRDHQTFHWHPNLEPPTYRRHTGMMDSVAAALCRCAVEDWLIGEGYHAFEWDHDSNTDLVVLILYDIEGRGPTIHHALIAAAHSVLDAQGTAP